LNKENKEIMKRRNRTIILLLVLVVAKNGLFAQQETPTEQFCTDSIKEYLIKYNIPAVGMQICIN